MEDVEDLAKTDRTERKKRGSTFSTVSESLKTRKAKHLDLPVIGSSFRLTDSISPNLSKYSLSCNSFVSQLRPPTNSFLSSAAATVSVRLHSMFSSIAKGN